VALTFDACETYDSPAGYDAAIIDILTNTQTPATLFMGGLWMQNHPDQTRQLANNPLFELGSHSWSHPDFSQISVEEMDTEIVQTQEMAWRLTGRVPTLFRLPFGTYTDQSLEVIASHGLRTIQWEVVSGDPDPNVQAEDMIRAITAEAQNGSIIMHMNGRGWHTAEALPTIIENLRAQGFTFVTVSQLLGLELIR
jgi:peptidoglycan/xylan/chitin deacetylase (PgdA/CDA1 family)